MYKIGIDLGGTNIAAGIVNDEYKIIRKTSKPTDRSTAESIVSGMADVVFTLCREEGISLSEISSIGVGAPGIVDSKKGVIDYVCNLPMRYFPLTEKLADALSYPKDKISADNDANAAALGEMLAGSGKGTTDFMMITLGTGVGGGVISEGRILPSFNHAGGELGHTVIVADGEPCGCGRHGCAEAYCSASALVRMANEALHEAIVEGIHSKLADYPEINGEVVFKAAADGDITAKDVLERYFRYVAIMLANFINIFQPEALAIGGGISGAGDALLLPLKELIFPDMIYNRDQPKELYTRLVLATLGGDAGIIGAAAL